MKQPINRRKVWSLKKTAKKSPKKTVKSLQPVPLARDLLAWYDRHRRHLPWRYPPGVAADPYAVWLSEIMLQQTTVAAVKPYFTTFMTRWPTVDDLAAAPLDDVLTAWAGLGYYARARNLHRCAQAVVKDHSGRFPDTEASLRDLPGIGPYTAAAVAAIAFSQRAVVVDGNVERVMARLYDVETPLPKAKTELHALADALTPSERAGDYAQAVMDLGATICTPKSPACAICPWQAPCLARRRRTALDRPKRTAKKATPTRYGMAFWIERPDGAVLLRRRPEKGLLGGMMEVPSTDWRAEPWTADAARAHAPATVHWTVREGAVSHTFTHFHLELSVLTGRMSAAAARKLDGPDLHWVHPDAFGGYALPNVMRKVVAHVSGASGASNAASIAAGIAVRRRRSKLS